MYADKVVECNKDESQKTPEKRAQKEKWENVSM